MSTSIASYARLLTRPGTGSIGTPSSSWSDLSTGVNRSGLLYMSSYYQTRGNRFSGLTRRVRCSRRPNGCHIGMSFGYGRMSQSRLNIWYLNGGNGNLHRYRT